ncbi:MAG: 6-phosphofructokinase [Campylobacterota bacterium]|nr:6-phosphofructokinase [Campylobacterota bacterium]
MSIAIITSGGDCAGMNPAIKWFVDYCFNKGLEPYFIYDGLDGLIDGNIKKATHIDVAGIVHLGGTVIRSSRSQRFYDKKYRQKAYENLLAHDIDKIVILGGDGSFRAMKVFHDEYGINFAGIPSTIDNDIFGTDYCLGVDTALNIIREATDSIRDTSSSFKRAFVIETMGRDCGYLALVSALTCGAEVCLIPEAPFDLESLKSKLKQELNNGRRYIICIVAEGLNITNDILKWLEKDIGIEARATVLGHIQRGGSPTVFDRLMASEYITYCVDKLIEDTENSKQIILYKDSKFKFESIEYVTSSKYMIKKELLKLGTNMMH